MKQMVLVAFVVLLASCKDGHRLGDYDVRDYFDDARVVSLAVAGAEGDVAGIRRLVESGVDVNAVGKDQMTPLWWAFLARNKAGVESLLHHGADPNAQQDHGDSLMCLAAEEKSSDFLRILIASGGDANLFSRRVDSRRPTPIFCAVSNESLENIRILDEAGANLDQKNSWSFTPLIRAANLNWWETVYTLLELGADYSIANRVGATIVFQIEHNGIDLNSDAYQWQLKVIQFLRKRGVEVNPASP